MRSFCKGHVVQAKQSSDLTGKKTVTAGRDTAAEFEEINIVPVRVNSVRICSYVNGQEI